MKILIKFIAVVLIVSATQKTFGQGSELYGKGIRINLDTTSKKYIRFITWHQFWIRGIENNPGTFVNGEKEETTWDVGLRRSRFLWLTQISPKFLILAHIGINNQTFVNGGGSGTIGSGGYGVGKKPQIFLHDMWTEYTVKKDKLYLGVGLHYWWGISRMTNASTLNFLALDAPIFNWPLIEVQDQFARQFGIYAKGKLGKIDYRLGLNKPFATPGFTANATNATPVSTNAWATMGYAAWEFFEKESNVLPFTVGTYMGTKKVFNIGAGFYSHPSSTATTTTNNGPKKHNTLLIGVDAFADLPLNKEKGTALTAYAVYYNYDFGPNYIRSVGIMNEGTPAPTGILTQGSGNAQYLIGTGNIFYTEAGLLLPKSWGGKIGRFQPFGTYTHKNFEALREASNQWGIGMNYFMDGHHSKISFKYQTRPLYDNTLLADKPQLNPGKNSAGEFIIQTMIYL